MRILVTGSTGVVGKYIVKELVKNAGPEDQIVALSRQNRYKYEDHPDKDNAVLLDCWADLTLSPVRLITQFSPTHIYHCCGNGQVGDYFNVWTNNVNTTFQLLRACCHLKNQTQFIHCSSIIAEQKPVTLYNAAKLTCEHLVESFTDMYGDKIDGKIIRFPAVAGAGNRHGVVKAIVDKLMDSETDTLKLLTNSRKPLLYSGDLAKLLTTRVLENKKRLINICSPDNISAQFIAQKAMFITNISKSIEWSGNSWAGDNNIIEPIDSEYKMASCHLAVSDAIKDILKEDYQWEK